MKLKTKLLMIPLALALAAAPAVSGCSGKPGGGNTAYITPPQDSTPAPPSPTPAPSPSPSSNTVVAPAPTPTPPPDAPPSPTPPPDWTPDPNLPAGAGTIGDYFPLTPGTELDYSDTNASADQKYYILFQNGGRTQRRCATATVGTTEVLDNTGGKLTLVFSDPLYDYFADMTGVKPTVNAVILQEPLSVGNRWKLDDMTTCEITSVDKQVTVPAGTYNCVTVETRDYKNNITQTDYYARGVGNVESDYAVNGQPASIKLSKITKDTPLTLPVKYANVNKDDKTVDNGTVQIQFRTNGSFQNLIEGVMKKPVSANNTPMLPQNAKINSLTFDWAGAKMTADFSAELYQNALSGDAAVQSNLQCIADTLGNFYRIDKVYITVAGKSFSQGGVNLNGQPVTVTGKADLKGPGSANKTN